MELYEFEEELKEHSEDLYVVVDGDLYLVYRKRLDGPEFIGSVSAIDVDPYSADDVIRLLEIDNS